MASELFRFGPFELDADNEELRRAGLVIRLPRQPLRILLLLVRRAGEVVSREEIQSAVWGDETYVDYEHGINSAIRAIRVALGDCAETPRYVRTLPRRGYSFVAPVERAEAVKPVAAEVVAAKAVARPPHSKTGIAAAILVVVALVALVAVLSRTRTTSRTVAIEPFRRLGPPIAGIDEHSFAEELRATLGKLPRQHVTVGNSRPDLVIGGTIREDADGVRVIVSAADAKSQTQIWSETFQRTPSRKEGMAVEVAHRTMHEVARRYLPAPVREPPLETKVMPSTFRLYKRARLLHARTQAYDWMRTKELYEAALREEPRFAEAWSGLSDVYILQALVKLDAQAAVQAGHCARRALALQPKNAEALSTLALLAAQRDYDLAAAEDLIRRAVAADPAYVDGRGNLAMILAMRGQFAESLREWKVAWQLDPVTNDLLPVEPSLYLYARRYDDARARYRDILAVNPESQPAHWGMMYTYVLQHNWVDGVAQAKLLREAPKDPIEPTQSGFMKLYVSFEPAMVETRRRERINDYFLAVYYAQCGRRDRALELLNRAVDTRVPAVSYIMVDPRLDPLRGDPRFNALLARLNLARPPQSLMARKPPPREDR